MATRIHSPPHRGFPDENKICQWYCCLCGQTFGQIYYKDRRSEPVPRSSVPIQNELIDKIKYYSQIVYNQHKPEDNDYFQYHPYPSSGLHSPLTVPLELRVGRFNVEDTTDMTEMNNSSNVMLKIPTRFTCHRCDHMMCPYCPKIRIKDLNNES